jgi:hypothetical protein
MPLIFKDRHGFFDKDNKYIGYIYEDRDTKRRFSIAHRVGIETYYINEIDDTFSADDNIYSTISARSLSDAKLAVQKLLGSTNEIIGDS